MECKKHFNKKNKVILSTTGQIKTKREENFKEQWE